MFTIPTAEQGNYLEEKRMRSGESHNEANHPPAMPITSTIDRREVRLTGEARLAAEHMPNRELQLLIGRRPVGRRVEWIDLGRGGQRGLLERVHRRLLNFLLREIGPALE